MILRGTVVSGRQEAAGFLAVPWVERQLRDGFGLTPYPGTLNLRLDDPDAPRRWARWQGAGGGRRLQPPEGSGFCAATCYASEVDGEVPGVVVVPEVEGYPLDVVEVMAAENLRRRLDLRDGGTCRLLLRPDSAPRIDGVLFDLEGTLVDFQWRLAEAEAELRAAAGTLLGMASLRFERDNYAAILRHALELAPTPETRLEIRRRLGPIYDRFDEDALSRWALREGARELLADLRGCGIRTGLVSNIGRQAVTGALGKFGLEDSLEAVVTRNDVEAMKPDGEGIRRAMADLEIAEGGTLMVGDSLSDLGAARSAGVAVAIVAGGESAPADVAAARPDHHLRRLAEVADLV